MKQPIKAFELHQGVEAGAQTRRTSDREMLRTQLPGIAEIHAKRIGRLK
jgi:hypothetical protein